MAWSGAGWCESHTKRKRGGHLACVSPSFAHLSCEGLVSSGSFGDDSALHVANSLVPFLYLQARQSCRSGSAQLPSNSGCSRELGVAGEIHAQAMRAVNLISGPPIRRASSHAAQPTCPVWCVLSHLQYTEPTPPPLFCLLPRPHSFPRDLSADVLLTLY